MLNSLQQVTTVPQIVELFHKKWNCSTKSGTVPQKVELFHFVSVFLDTAMAHE